MKINELKSTLTSNKKNKRRGRGSGSGLGKTSGRGVKGQKSRSGVAIKSFEGGQMPLYRRLPKRGFNSLQKEKISILNLENIQNFIERNIIKAGTLINIDSLKKVKILNKSITKFKVLGNGEIKNKIEIEVDYISKSAKEKIEKLGGKINIKNTKK